MNLKEKIAVMQAHLEGAVYNDKPTMQGARDFYGRVV